MGLASLLVSLWFAPRGRQPAAPRSWSPSWASAALGVGLGPPLWLHFFLRFPHPFALRTNRRFLAVLYGCSLGGAFLVLAELLVRTLGRPGAVPGLPALHGLAGPVRAVHLRLRAPGAGPGRAWPCSGPAARRQRSRKRRALLPALLLAFRLLAGPAGLPVHPAAERRRRACVFARGSWVWLRAPAPAALRVRLRHLPPRLFRRAPGHPALGLLLHRAGADPGGLPGRRGVPVRGGPAGDPARLGRACWWAFPPCPSAGCCGPCCCWPCAGSFRRDLNTARETILGDLRENRQRFSEEAILDCLAESLRTAFRPQLLLLLPADGGRLPRCRRRPSDRRPPARPGPGRGHALRLPPGPAAPGPGEPGAGAGPAERRGGLDPRAGAGAAGPHGRPGGPGAGPDPGQRGALRGPGPGRQVRRTQLRPGGPGTAPGSGHRHRAAAGDRPAARPAAGPGPDRAGTAHRPADPAEPHHLQGARRWIGFQVALRLAPALETGGDLLWVARGLRAGISRRWAT